MARYKIAMVFGKFVVIKSEDGFIIIDTNQALLDHYMKHKESILHELERHDKLRFMVRIKLKSPMSFFRNLQSEYRAHAGIPHNAETRRLYGQYEEIVENCFTLNCEACL